VELVGSGRLLGMCKTFLISSKWRNQHRGSHRVYARKAQNIIAYPATDLTPISKLLLNKNNEKISLGWLGRRREKEKSEVCVCVDYLGVKKVSGDLLGGVNE
jgi:hypothetical protein